MQLTLYQSGFKLSSTTKSLIAFTVLCFSLSIIRLYMKHDMMYLFLTFNLFLAWVPYFIAKFAQRFVTSWKGIYFLLLAFWVLFFPNAPYIITDLLHFKNYAQGILWFDSLLVFVYALSGLLLGAHSLRLVQASLQKHFGKKLSWAFASTVLLLSGFGIYLGRYCRLNSWDILQDPLWFFDRVLYQFQNPLMYQVTLIYGTVLLFSYSVFTLSLDRRS